MLSYEFIRRVLIFSVLRFRFLALFRVARKRRCGEILVGDLAAGRAIWIVSRESNLGR